MLHPREHRRFSVDEYFLLEEQSPSKNEFWAGEIFAMSGGSLEHNCIVANLIWRLGAALEGKNCRVYPSDLRVYVERRQLITYPDVLVVCGAPRLLTGRRDTITDATVILEVLSPSTQDYDKNEKFRSYRELPSFGEYLLISQDEVRVEQHRRQAPGEWLMNEHTSLAAVLELSSIGVDLTISSLYAGVFSD
ncbi:Uma2 family endonuclease [bacterium]|nr:Uma2 family endonuclease [bacterium]